uniref:Chorismate lyase n=1 Tax=Lophocladia kuetzingii TaxID=675577 RepID=A0A1Z1MNF3_9FLOR|nr:hypothetical protein [Lophocladia kuetzingii]ARW67588.1 hypothetical protein [Lophocladia kuetzingii]
MDFNIYTFNEFHSICNLPIYKIEKLNKKLLNLIPIQIKLLLINEGSLTKNVEYLSGKITKIFTMQKENRKSKINIRCVWLETSIYTRLIFARSLWCIIYKNTMGKENNIDKPIGKLYIKHQVDIYKDIHEIYYGYCQNIEKCYQTQIKNTPMWGRKYSLYYENESYIIIQEFFSPYIINLF